MQRESHDVSSFLCHIAGGNFGIFGREKAKKNGVPPYPNLVNLKSNTMKNTRQRYADHNYRQTLLQKISSVLGFFMIAAQ